LINPGSTVTSVSISESENIGYQTSGSFGARYSLGRHFGVFGEAGVAYTKTTTTLTSSFQRLPDTSRSTTGRRADSDNLATCISLGVVVYF
jgi:hypothetical protein